MQISLPSIPSTATVAENATPASDDLLAVGTLPGAAGADAEFEELLPGVTLEAKPVEQPNKAALECAAAELAAAICTWAQMRPTTIGLPKVHTDTDAGKSIDPTSALS